jgi:hypothetical protein
MTNNQNTWKETVFRPMVERYKAQHRQKNIWLNPMEPDIKSPPKIGYGRIPRTDVAGLRAEIDTILRDVLDPHTGQVRKYGRLRYRQMKLKEKRAAFEHFIKAQPGKANDTKPTGRWLEEIAELTARVELEEETSRLLHNMLRETKEKQKAAELARRKPIGCVKLKDGQPWRVDGRDLVETENGEFMLADTGVLLNDYLAEVKATRLKKIERKRAADVAHRTCAAC